MNRILVACYVVGTIGASAEVGVNVKHIIFMRHVESTWNEGKSNGDMLRFLKSKYKDADLSEAGVEQAVALRKWIFEKGTCSRVGARKAIGGLLGITDDIRPDDESAIPSCNKEDMKNLNSFPWATSNLRRALKTALYAMGLPENHANQLFIMSALQELESGLDAKSLTIEKIIPEIDWKSFGVEDKWESETIHKKGWFGRKIEETIQRRKIDWVDTRFNFGDYNEMGAKAGERFTQFCGWASAIDTSGTLVVVGHSSWLQKFFRRSYDAGRGLEEFNMAEVMLMYKEWDYKVKLDNAGVIEFDLDVTECKFKPKTTQLVYGSWSVKKDHKLIPGFLKPTSALKTHLISVVTPPTAESSTHTKGYNKLPRSENSLTTDSSSDSENDE